MAVVAKLSSGQEVPLHEKLGETPDEVVASLTAEALTGSAVPFGGVWVTAADGSLVNAAEIVALRDSETRW